MVILTEKEIKQINKKDHTLVLRKGKVYDVTKFCNSHPGGKNLIMNFHGKDVTKVMESGVHKHSKNAYEWLQQYYIADFVKDNKEVEFLENDNNQKNEKVQIPQSVLPSPVPAKDLVDWSKPMLWQVGDLGAKYHDWVDKPVDRKLRLFKSDFVEYFSNTSWYVIPIVWIPFAIMLLMNVLYNYPEIVFFKGITYLQFEFPLVLLPLVFAVGVLFWSLLEYSLHRWLFHASPPVESYSLITLHFLLHGQHHKVPFDKGRLVFPPVASSVFAIVIYVAFTSIFPTGFALTFMAGIISGYVGYDLTHYYLHYGSPSKGGYFDRLRSYHVRHHFENPDLGYGISSKFWDYPFNTLIQSSETQKTK